jgi:hypothetical protein
MKYIFLYLLLIIYFLQASISCSKPPCECNFIPADFIEIKIYNQQSQNLIFGPYAIYKSDSIQILKEKGNTSIDNASVQTGITDSTAIRLNFYLHETKNYIYYNDHTPPDSLEVIWLTKKGKCCGNQEEYRVVDSVKFNNMPVKADKGVYYFVK